MSSRAKLVWSLFGNKEVAVRKSHVWNSCHSVLTVVLALGLASCATGPDYERPEVAAPDRFKSAVADEIAEPNLALDWWRLFGDPELDALEEEALNANLSLQAAMARVAQARASARAVKSEFFPVVAMSPSATRSRASVAEDSDSTEEKIEQATTVVNKVTSLVQKIGALSQSATSSTDTTGTGTSTTTSTSSTSSSGIGSLLSSAASSSSETVSPISNSYRVPFDLSYEIDIWGRVRRSYESARAQVRASEYDLEVVRQTLLADVAQNYFSIRSLDEQEAILNRNLAAYQEQVDLTEFKYKAGLIGETDVLQATLLLESARADMSDIQRQRADLEHAIAILIGQAPVDFTLPAHTLDTIPPAIPAGLPGDLLRRRPDVAEAEQDLIAACAEIGVAKAEFFPTITLTGSAGFESNNVRDVLDWNSRVWSIGPSISLPIFEGGKLRANLREAKARYDEMLATYRESILTAYVDVEDSLTDLHLRAEQAGSQEKALNASREYVRLTRIQYESGIVDYLNVVDAEQSSLTNELSAVQIRNQRLISTVLLMKALGGGWEAPGNDAFEAPDAPVAATE